ncbi:MAG: molybdate ABC transporter substrate-binding protein [Thalassobaculales bacterium]
MRVLAAAALAMAPFLPAPARAQDAVVFAAASLKSALDEVAAGWAGRAAISYAASSAQARQIEQGAPADLFLPADLDWMDYLQQRGLIRADSRVNLLGNAMVLIAPAGSAVRASLAPGLDLAGLLGGGRLAIAQVDSVPAGKYGRAALEHLGLWEGVKHRLIQTAHVQAALVLVARGEVPLGIVYRTDAAATPAVGVIDSFPAASHPPIVYPAALTAASARPRAGAFLAHLRAPTAAAIFRRHGFTVSE